MREYVWFDNNWTGNPIKCDNRQLSHLWVNKSVEGRGRADNMEGKYTLAPIIEEFLSGRVISRKFPNGGKMGRVCLFPNVWCQPSWRVGRWKLGYKRQRKDIKGRKGEAWEDKYWFRRTRVKLLFWALVYRISGYKGLSCHAGVPECRPSTFQLGTTDGKEPAATRDNLFLWLGLCT